MVCSNLPTKPGRVLTIWKQNLYGLWLRSHWWLVGDQSAIGWWLIGNGSEIGWQPILEGVFIVAEGCMTVWSLVGNRLSNTRQIQTVLRSSVTTADPFYMTHPSPITPVTFFRSMMTSSNGSIFHVTGHLCGEFTGFTRTKASDAELWCFL